MVRKVLSRYIHSPPSGNSTTEKIQTTSALYSPDEAIALIDPDNIFFETRNVEKDIDGLNWDIDELCDFLRYALMYGVYLSSEWCLSSKGHWLACDSYRVFRNEYIEAAYKEMQIEYYLKYCIGKSGATLLLVSCHLPRQR